MTVKKYKWNGQYSARDGFYSSQGDLELVSGSIIMGATTLTESDLAFANFAAAGTVEASKAVVVDSNKDVSAFRTVGVVNLDAGSSGVAGTVDVFPSTASKGKLAITVADATGNTTTTVNVAAQATTRTYTVDDYGASGSFAMLGAAATAVIGSTPAEIDAICDASASAETRTGAGAISATVAYTSLVTTGADALTLAAPGAASAVRTKVIHMTTDGGDGTLASTNIVGQSSGTTSITFNDAGDYLILVSVPGLNKWSVVKEGGVTAA